MMKKVWLILILIAVFYVGIALNQTRSLHNTQIEVLTKPQSNLHSSPTDFKSPSYLQNVEPQDFSTWLRLEAQQVGQIDLNPNATKARLESKALSLSNSEMNSLHKMIENSAISPDQRFLAVYLLSLNASQEARNHLSQISLLPIADVANDRIYSDELIIRMQALEALVSALPAAEAQGFLAQYLRKQSNPSLARYARRLL